MASTEEAGPSESQSLDGLKPPSSSVDQPQASSSTFADNVQAFLEASDVAEEHYGEEKSEAVLEPVPDTISSSHATPPREKKAPEGVTGARSLPLGVLECGNYDKEAVDLIVAQLLSVIGVVVVERMAADLFSQQPRGIAEGVRKDLFEFLEKRSTAAVAAAAAAAAASASVSPSSTGKTAGGLPTAAAMGAGLTAAMKGFSMKEKDHETDATEAVVVPEDEALQRHPVVRRLKALLDEFVDNRRSLLWRISAAFGSDGTKEKLDVVVQELEASGFWETAHRENLARALVKRMDDGGEDHCVHEFLDTASLQRHREKCSFRLLQCDNTPCAFKTSAKHLQAHDDVCPHKILPCAQSCMATMARALMATHCTTVCPLKSVSCPFGSVGCGVGAIAQCNLDTHCRESQEPHLRLLLRVVLQLDSTGANHDQRIKLLEQGLALMERSDKLETRSMELHMKELSSKVNSLELELTRTKQELKVAQGFKKDISVVKEHVKTLQKLTLQSTR